MSRHVRPHGAQMNRICKPRHVQTKAKAEGVILNDAYWRRLCEAFGNEARSPIIHIKARGRDW